MSNRIEQAELVKVLENTLNELEHWHGWRCHTTPTYVDSDGFRVCKGRIDRACAVLEQCKQAS